MSYKKLKQSIYKLNFINSNLKTQEIIPKINGADVKTITKLTSNIYLSARCSILIIKTEF